MSGRVEIVVEGGVFAVESSEVRELKVAYVNVGRGHVTTMISLRGVRGTMLAWSLLVSAGWNGGVVVVRSRTLTMCAWGGYRRRIGLLLLSFVH